MSKKLLLTVTMLVSNREDTIEKCMESIKPLLDSVSSELIIVDTAGNPYCMEIVRRYTNKIIPFKWRDDFAAARNAGLKRAKGEWAMFLDDDEWFEDISEIRDFFLNGTYRNYLTAAYITRNYTNKEGTEWKDGKAVRLARLGENTRFKGRIHEQFYPMLEPTYFMKAYVHHYGYVYSSETEKMNHSWRNIRLILESIKEKPDDWKAKGQLIQEYIAVKEFFSAIETAKELRKSKDRYEYGINEFAAYAAVKEIDLYLRQERYQEAYEVGKEVIGDTKSLLLGRVCAARMMPLICLKQNRYNEILDYIKVFRSLMEEWEQKREENYATDSFSITDYYLKKEELTKIDFLELHAYVREESWDKAAEVFLKVRWDEVNELFSNTPDDVVRLIVHTEYQPAYAKALELMIKGEGTKRYLSSELDRLEGDDKRRLLYAAAQISDPDITILKYKLYYQMQIGDIAGVKAVLGQWKQENYSFFFPDAQYFGGLRELGIDLSEWISQVRIYDWITLTEALFEQMDEEACEDIYQVLIRGLDNADIRLLHITALNLEKRLLVKYGNIEKTDMPDKEEVWGELRRIAQLWVGCAAMLYQEQVFRSGLQTALPGRYQFAWLIFQADAVKEDTRSFVKKVAEAAQAHLGMEGICKMILRLCKENAEERKET